MPPYFWAHVSPNIWSSSLIVPPTAHRELWQFVSTLGNREFFQTGRSGRLNNSYKGNIMRCQFIEFNLQFFHVTGSICELPEFHMPSYFSLPLPWIPAESCCFLLRYHGRLQDKHRFVQFHNSSSIHKIWSV